MEPTTNTAIYLVLPEEASTPLAAERLEQVIQLYMHRRGIVGTTRWFYDEFAPSGYIEYGVHLAVSDLNDTPWVTMVGALGYICGLTFTGIRIDPVG